MEYLSAAEYLDVKHPSKALGGGLVRNDSHYRAAPPYHAVTPGSGPRTALCDSSMRLPHEVGIFIPTNSMSCAACKAIVADNP